MVRDAHPERLTIAAEDAFHAVKQGRAVTPSEAGEAAHANAEKAAEEAKREQYRAMFRQAREDSRDEPEWER